MAKNKVKWDLLTDEKKNSSIREIIVFFKTERDEEIGMIAAEKILDHFLETVGITLYNKGVDDSKDFLAERIEGIELDMESFLKK